MLSMTDVNLENVAAELAKFGVEAAYFVPTPTGMSKSIIDAHENLRTYLRINKVHDFSNQGQGQIHKRKVTIRLVQEDVIVERELSLYRPNTKNGDPRFWIGNLRSYAEPFNLIALITCSSGELFAINCSNANIWNSRSRTGSPLSSLLKGFEKSDTASELLKKLEEVSALGFVDTLRNGPTGVGFTLETLLGIPANSSRNPDYKGIELKSGRTPVSGRQKSRSTLFSQVPNWELSLLKSGREILDTYGYLNQEKNRLQLYCSISNTPNSQGLVLRSELSGDQIEAIALGPTGGERRVVSWLVAELQESLALKHKETFWIKAHQRVRNGQEQFHFVEVTHTRRPLVANFGLLVELGKIELDLTLSEKDGGGIRDHGYLFKIWSENFDLLFPMPINYVLSV